jgi:maltokinase
LNPSSTASDGIPSRRWPPLIGDGATARLVGTLSEGADPEDLEVLRFHPLPPIQVTAAERGFDVDQTNRSVVVDERVVVKWLTPPLPLPQPAPEVFAHLTAVGFTETALPYAALWRRSPGGTRTLVALVTAYLPGARDGWEWCVDEAVAGRTGFAADLGRLAADLHAAMATPSPAFPDPLRRGDPGEGGRWAARAGTALGEALELTGGEDGAWLAARAGTLRREIEALARAGTTPLIRIHGDLHVGQTLRWRDGYAVIDFDGNPTVPDAGPFQPAARDLAQLATSLEHVAQVAIRRRDAAPARMAAWAATARDVLASAYRERLAWRGMPALLDETLLGPFEIEQECRELIYAARHLPRWRYAPMGVLRARFPALPGTRPSAHPFREPHRPVQEK